MINPKPLLTDYDKNPLPNPNPKTFHGKWTDWPELHDQKSLNPEQDYYLRLKGAVPKGGKPFFVEQPHPADCGDARLVLGKKSAKTFRGIYLLRTMWDWELKFEAIADP